LAAGGSVDLRRELGGYAYIGVQIAVAGAGALLLATGLRSATGVAGAPEALAALAWHVVDSVPGPDLPELAGWRAPVQVTGPVAGAVLAGTVAMLLICVVFPMTRAVRRWAAIAAGSPAADRPLAEIPAALLADVEFVRDFLIESVRPETQDTIRGLGESGEQTAAQAAFLEGMHQAEERLSAAERDRSKLRDLLGEESPVYWAADQAVSAAADAYRTVIQAQLAHHSRRWSPWPSREAGIDEAITAIGVYAAAVDRWQMGADVVTEIETRLHHLDTREHGIDAREQDALAREHGVRMREHGVDARERMLELREGAAHAREESVEAREQAAELREAGVAGREEEIDLRERTVEARESGTEQREQDADLRERSVTAREQALTDRELAAVTREQDVATKERATAVRVQEIDAREHWVQAREQNADIREQSVVTRERNALDRERAVDLREQDGQ
ncbi:MAG: hypothetical protein HOV79_22245, partial [Hamadaea sp.]|nr:hypothetical protein [Hamadaea sp.]